MQVALQQEAMVVNLQVTVEDQVNWLRNDTVKFSDLCLWAVIKRIIIYFVTVQFWVRFLYILFLLYTKINCVKCQSVSQWTMWKIYVSKNTFKWPKHFSIYVYKCTEKLWYRQNKSAGNTCHMITNSDKMHAIVDDR